MFLREADLLKLPNMSTLEGMAEMLSRFIWLLALGLLGLPLFFSPTLQSEGNLSLAYTIFGAFAMAFVFQYFLLWSKRSRTRYVSLAFALTFSLPVISTFW
jgi:hypothetical protein